MKPYAHGGHEVRVWYKTPTVLLIIKYGKSRVGVRWNTTSTSKEKDPLPFKIGYYVKINQFMINICKMIAGLEQRCLVWAAFVLADDLCPERHCNGHTPYNNVCVVKCKLHAAGILLLMNELFDYWKSEGLIFITTSNYSFWFFLWYLQTT